MSKKAALLAATPGWTVRPRFGLRILLAVLWTEVATCVRDAEKAGFDVAWPLIRSSSGATSGARSRSRRHRRARSAGTCVTNLETRHRP